MHRISLENIEKEIREAERLIVECKYKEAIQALRPIVSNAKQLFDDFGGERERERRVKAFGTAFAELSTSYLKLKKYERTAKVSNRFLQIGRKLKNEKYMYDAYTNLGLVYTSRAEEIFINGEDFNANEESITLYEEKEQHYFRLLDEALRFFQKSFRLIEVHPETLDQFWFGCIVNKAEVYFLKGKLSNDYKAAEILLKESLKRKAAHRFSSDSQSPDEKNNIGKVHDKLGHILLAQKKSKEALQHFEQDQAICAQNNDPEGEIKSLKNISICYNEMGDLEMAEMSINRAKDIARKERLDRAIKEDLDECLEINKMDQEVEKQFQNDVLSLCGMTKVLESPSEIMKKGSKLMDLAIGYKDTQRFLSIRQFFRRLFDKETHSQPMSPSVFLEIIQTKKVLEDVLLVQWAELEVKFAALNGSKQEIIGIKRVIDNISGLPSEKRGLFLSFVAEAIDQLKIPDPDLVEKVYQEALLFCEPNSKLRLSILADYNVLAKDNQKLEKSQELRREILAIQMHLSAKGLLGEKGKVVRGFSNASEQANMPQNRKDFSQIQNKEMLLRDYDKETSSESSSDELSFSSLGASAHRVDSSSEEENIQKTHKSTIVKTNNSALKPFQDILMKNTFCDEDVKQKTRVMVGEPVSIIDFSFSFITALGVEHLLAPSINLNLGFLRILSLKGSKVNWASEKSIFLLQSLLSRVNNRAIQKIDLSYQSFPSKTLLRFLLTQASAEHLKYSGNQSLEAVESIPTPAFGSVEKLSVKSFEKIHPKILRRFFAWPSLKKLDVSYGGLQEATLSSIEEETNDGPSSLEVLRARGFDWGGQGAQWRLTKFYETFKKLKELDLSEASLKNFEAMAEFIIEEMNKDSEYLNMVLIGESVPFGITSLKIEGVEVEKAQTTKIKEFLDLINSQKEEN